MPKPICNQCHSEKSLLWRVVEIGKICNECYFKNETKDAIATNSDKDDDLIKQEEKDEKHDDICDIDSTAKTIGRGMRKSTRSTRYKPKAPSTPTLKTPSTRGRGRRSIFKKNPPMKAPTATATVVTSKSVFHNGSYMQVGDIVSMVGLDGGIYYAQLRGFMTDQYCEKSAVVTWLLPTKASPPPEDGFDPATYIFGPEDELPRKLECMEFIMHAPSDYYKASNTPYPLTDCELNNYTGFVWTPLEAKEKA